MISDRALLRLLRTPYAVALFGDLVRVILASALVALALMALVYDAMLFHLMLRDLHFNDFGKFYYSTRYFLDNVDMYGPSPATFLKVNATDWQQFWNLNPPHFHIFLLPVALLSPGKAYFVWSLASAIAFGLSLKLILDEVGIRPRTSRTLKIAVALCWFAGSTTLIITGQLSWLLMWPATKAWIAMRHGHWTRAGSWWGFCIGVKPFLVVFLAYFMIMRRLKATVAAGLTIAFSFAVGLLVFGLEPHKAWVAKLGESATWSWSAMNAGLLSILARSLMANPYYEPVAIASSFVAPIWVGFSIAAGTAALWCFYRRRWVPDPDEDTLILLLLAIVVSPLGWVYYLWLLFGPAYAVACRHGRMPFIVKVGIVGLLFPMHLTTIGQPNAWITASLGSLYAWSMILIYCGVAFASSRRTGQATKTLAQPHSWSAAVMPKEARGV